MTKIEGVIAELKQVVFDFKLKDLSERSGVHPDRIRRILRQEPEVVRNMIAMEKAGAQMLAEREEARGD